jgi:hypothetical protein
MHVVLISPGLLIVIIRNHGDARRHGPLLITF